MLQYTNNPKYHYYAYSMNQEEIIATLSLTLPTTNEDRKMLQLFMQTEEYSEENKQILANDIVNFITYSFKKPDSI